jgi:phospholipid-binding lipoprotein MlaA
MIKNITLSALFSLFFLINNVPFAKAEESELELDIDPFEKFEISSSSEQGLINISDPIECYNRAIFAFNDNVYFYSIKPIAQLYNKVLPEKARISVKNFFLNLATPTRFVNCLFQGKFKGAGTELSRFFINTTLGIAGFFDPANASYGLPRYDEDSGQTFGLYGMGQGIYIVWPFIGPSSIRDTAGLIADIFLDPLYYTNIELWENVLIEGYKMVNSTSLRIGDYEELKNSAIDPYVSLRNAYIQLRQNAVSN